MVPRDVNYDFLRQYIHRIDRTIKRGRNKGIMATSNGKDSKLMNDFLYYLAKVNQMLP